MKIAILGGSFDPIHIAHIALAKKALHLFADEVWFMPTAQTPLKERVLSEAKDRLAMIRLAIKPYRHMRVSTLEINRGGASYTIDTVYRCIKKYPQHTFYWLIGSDQEAQLSKWKDIDQLCSLVTICVYPRENFESLHQYPVQYIDMKPIDSSSTMVRSNQLFLVPDSVCHYIGQHGLYIESMVASVMTKKRYEHSLRVAKLCETLAIAHGVNAHQAYVAGMFHDVCKEWPYEKASLWMQHLEPLWSNQPPAVWHGFIASRYIKRYYAIFDKQVSYAIRWHVLGSEKTKLAMILFVADKLETGRGYDTSAEIALCMQNLKKGFDVVLKQQHQYLQKKGEHLHE